MQFYTHKPQEENKVLLEKLREGMQELAYLKERERNPNFQAEALANLNSLRKNHNLEWAPSQLNLNDGTDGINYDT